MEKTQRAEVRAVQRAKAEAEAARFRDVVLAADPEAQRAVAPFLSIPVLRRIVATLCNDTSGTFSERALNPTILARLHEARTALKEGRMTEAEAEHIMLAHAKARARKGCRLCRRLFVASVRLSRFCPPRTRFTTRKRRRSWPPIRSWRCWTRRSWWAR